MAPNPNIQKTLWQTEEEKVEAVTDLNLLGFKNHYKQWLQP